MIAENLEAVRRRIAKCCKISGRPTEAVTLICVTKEATIEEAAEVLRLGVRDFGENRAQELLSKYRHICDKAVWHFIGHLQTNKVRDAVRISSLIHSVDSLKIAKKIDKEAAGIGKVQSILIQVNVSGERTKSGIKAVEAMDFLKALAACPNILVKGLMTIAPEAGGPEGARQYFRMLRQIRDEVVSRLDPSCSVLSMGMTGDFEAAIEEGADMIRIGRAIFGR